MNINSVLNTRKMSKYSLSKISNVPYSTISDICSFKTDLSKCSVETVYKIARALEIPMETLVEELFEKRISFELFKGNECHKLKRMGDLDYILDLLSTKRINLYYQKKWYPECLYLLAMLDYLSRINNLDICKDYNSMRNIKLDHVIYPSSILAISYANNSDEVKERSIKESIPEFIRHNIVESDIRNVI